MSRTPPGDGPEIRIENRIHQQRGPERVSTTLRMAASGDRSIHPALIPGISVEETEQDFPTSRLVFLAALVFIVAVVVWALIDPDSLNSTGVGMQSWVVAHFGWLFTSLVVAANLFMLIVGYGPTGRIRLGADDSTPEFSTASWISMLFAAGLGIGLVFYGPFEPLTHFLTPPPAAGDVTPESVDAVLPAMAHSILHQSSLSWGVYALVGGALAYGSYRRGRLPLISAVFEPVFPDGSHRFLGKTIDVFAVLVTLFGTATSLGIGALQIRTGTSLLTGRELTGDGFVVVIMSVLSVLFILSAVSGVKRGIRLLSNTNMVLVLALAGFVLFTGPTLFILDLLPATVYQFFQHLPDMLSVSSSQGEMEQQFVTAWTTLFWAWWLSWSPFVGMFIAKISKGRTLREYVTVVVFAPVTISVIWFVVFGGTAIKQRLDGIDLQIEGAGENVMFDVVSNLPLAGVTSVVVLIAIIIFFTTAADSATNVMASMSQNGRPVASTPVTIIWGLALGAVSISLLLAGGQNALSGLQSIMVTCSLPFAVILIGMMISWAKDLHDDPLMIRRRYTREAIRRGVEQAIDEHGDDFVFGASHVDSEKGAGAGFDSEDPAYSQWYTGTVEEVPPEPTQGPGGQDRGPKP